VVLRAAATVSGVSRVALEALYRDGDDPWRHRSSRYERVKFARTLASLARPRYRSILEIGCGNGELGRHLARRAVRYTGLDAARRALAAARVAVPEGHFVARHLPAPLPDGEHDLVVLSEVLYFLDADGVRDVAEQIDTRWPTAEIVAVNYLGASAHVLDGETAVGHFARALRGDYTYRGHRLAPRYRIDAWLPARGTRGPAVRP